MAAVIFPRKLLREADHDWNIAGNTMVAGVASGASVDVRSDGGGLWVASINNIQFWDASFTLCWRAVRQLCNGGVTPIVVPRNDIAFAPFPNGSEIPQLPFSDSSLFSDGAGFYQPAINIVAGVGGAALRATSLPIVINVAKPLQGGESFSINHPIWGWRLYEIGTVTMSDAGHGVITFNPPLREAVDAGTQLEFDRPRCTMKLVNAGAMDLNVTTWPFSCPSVKFVESKWAA